MADDADLHASIHSRLICVLLAGETSNPQQLIGQNNPKVCGEEVGIPITVAGTPPECGEL